MTQHTEQEVKPCEFANGACIHCDATEREECEGWVCPPKRPWVDAGAVLVDGRKSPEQQDSCFCHDGVSLQIVSGGAAPEGYLGKVTLLIDGKYVDYVKAQPEQDQSVTDELQSLRKFHEAAFLAHPNIDLDIEAAHGIKEQP
jgi:hypothetical protein